MANEFCLKKMVLIKSLFIRASEPGGKKSLIKNSCSWLRSHGPAGPATNPLRAACNNSPLIQCALPWRRQPCSMTRSTPSTAQQTCSRALKSGHILQQARKLLLAPWDRLLSLPFCRRKEKQKNILAKMEEDILGCLSVCPSLFYHVWCAISPP